MEELKAKMMATSLKHAEMFAKEMAMEIVFPALKMAVEKSSSKIDDMVMSALEAPMKQAALELIDQIYKDA